MIQETSVYCYILYINYNIVDEVLTYYAKSVIYGFLFSSFFQLLFLFNQDNIFSYHTFIIINLSSLGMVVLIILATYKRLYDLYKQHILDENLQQLLEIVV